MPSENPISALESLLFVSGEPVSFARIAKILGIKEQDVSMHVASLAEKYQRDEKSGLMLITKEKKILLATKPENGSCIEELTKSALQEHLSKPALEVLSIIAYRSPITRSEIEAIRGVNCSFTVRNLLLRDLIERRENPNDAREYVYYPTFRFLQSLGLQRTEDLPEYVAMSQDERLKMVASNDGEFSVDNSGGLETETKKKV